MTQLRLYMFRHCCMDYPCSHQYLKIARICKVFLKEYQFDTNFMLSQVIIKHTYCAIISFEPMQTITSVRVDCICTYSIILTRIVRIAIINIWNDVSRYFGIYICIYIKFKATTLCKNCVHNLTYCTIYSFKAACAFAIIRIDSINTCSTIFT